MSNEVTATMVEEVGEMTPAVAGETAPEAAGELMPAASGVERPETIVVDREDGTRVVRLLSVGQQIQGVVKRVSEFGAFVDIGVGRDGLVHISELSTRRIAKVTDVLQEGQQMTFWIKKLDRERNRISLTMIEPGVKTIRNMEKGDIVQGTVTRIMPYGAFLDIGIGRDALLHVREMGQRYVAKPEDVVNVGDVLDARIIDISRRRARVDLSIKGLRPEPEPELPPEPQTPIAPEPEPEEEEASFADTYDEVEALSPMEAAFRKAMEANGMKLNRRENKKNRKNENARTRAVQEDLLSRTLRSGGKK